jgi:uncharacterized membrane protein HdeD (DUF308 family)
MQVQASRGERTMGRHTAFRLDFSRHWWVLTLRGVVAIVFGYLALGRPGAPADLLAVGVGAFMAMEGILALATGLDLLHHHRRGAALVAEGLLGLFIAGLVLQWSEPTVGTVAWLTAAWAILTGCALLWGCLAMPLPGGRLSMALAALLSLGLGALLIKYLVARTVLIELVLGIYALASGGLLVSLGFRLRRARHRVVPVAQPAPSVTNAARERSKPRKRFFFGKKNQKTFAS